MKKFWTFWGLVWLLAGYLPAQDYLMIIGKDTVYPEEFEYMYTKNLDLVQDPRQKDIDYYKDLFINYKLQLQDARATGMDKDWNFKAEYRKYRNELAKKYLVDSVELNRLLHEAYDRMHTDVKVSHIMVSLPQDALPADTLKAWRKIRQIYGRLRRGANFEKTALAYSEDPTARENKGHLGWINVFHTWYPFETAAYETAEGHISAPVRTPVGYHVVKVEKKRPAVYRVQVAQIMVRKGKDTAAARRKIMAIYDELRSGKASFEELARRYSDDKISAKRGGLLPPFGLRQKIEPFEEQAFALDSVGQISRPFQTPKAWHILRLVRKEPVPPFEQVKADLEHKVMTDERGQAVYRQVKELARRRVQVTEPVSYKRAFDYLGREFYSGHWKLPADWRQATDVIMVLNNDQKIYLRDFLHWLSRHQPRNPRSYRYRQQLLKQLYERFKDQKILQYYAGHLENWYPDFARTTREYYDGLLLFRYKSRHIWEKALNDTTGLQQFYEQNKERYRQPKRYRIAVVQTDDKKQARKWYRRLKKGKMRMEDVMALKQKGAQVKVSIVEENRLPEALKHQRARLSGEGPYRIQAVVDSIESFVPPLEKIRGKVLADYQQYLEDQLLEELHRKYPVRINEHVWNTLRAKYKK